MKKGVVVDFTGEVINRDIAFKKVLIRSCVCFAFCAVFNHKALVLCSRYY